MEVSLLLQESIVHDGGDVKQGVAHSQNDLLVRH